MMALSLSIINTTFPPAERGRAIGIWAGISGLGSPSARCSVVCSPRTCPGAGSSSSTCRSGPRRCCSRAGRCASRGTLARRAGSTSPASCCLAAAWRPSCSARWRATAGASSRAGRSPASPAARSCSWRSSCWSTEGPSRGQGAAAGAGRPAARRSARRLHLRPVEHLPRLRRDLPARSARHRGARAAKRRPGHRADPRRRAGVALRRSGRSGGESERGIATPLLKRHMRAASRNVRPAPGRRWHG